MRTNERKGRMQKIINFHCIDIPIYIIHSPGTTHFSKAVQNFVQWKCFSMYGGLLNENFIEWPFIPLLFKNYHYFTPIFSENRILPHKLNISGISHVFQSFHLFDGVNAKLHWNFISRAPLHLKHLSQIVTHSNPPPTKRTLHPFECRWRWIRMCSIRTYYKFSIISQTSPESLEQPSSG